MTHGEWTGGLCGGFAAYVEQGRYGLPLKKATWIYAFGVELRELRWGYTADSGSTGRGRPEHGGLDGWRDTWAGWQIRLGQRKPDIRVNGRSSATPPAFRDVLLEMARSASRVAV
jgi:hypothetical protein